MLKGFLIILVIGLVVTVQVASYKQAPEKARQTLINQGYQQVSIEGLTHFKFDFCSKGVHRVSFSAHKNGKKVHGYVCLEHIFKHTVHLE